MTGQLTCGVDANYEHPSSRTASNLRGVFFQPKFPQATVRISFTSLIIYWWYVHSVHGKQAVSQAQGVIELRDSFGGPPVNPPLRSRAFLNFSETAMNSQNFDVVNEAGPRWSLEAPVTMSENNTYYIVVKLTCSASGTGWPGALAGANAIVTVPSITLTLTATRATSNP